MYKNTHIKDLDKALCLDADGFTVAIFEDFELKSAFQPIISLGQYNQALFGYEALVRPYQRNIPVSPEVFFTSIRRKNRLFIEQLCCLLHINNARRLDLNGTNLFLNINPSAYTNRADVKPWVDLFTGHMKYNGLDPHHLVCEVVERPAIHDRTMRQVIDCFRETGTKIAIDNFGINSSNFDRLLSFRPDLVKIDQFYLYSSRHNPAIKKLFQSIANLLHEFKLELIIEGIETFDDLELSKELTAHYGQGFFIGHPSERPDLEPDCIETLKAEYSKLYIQEKSLLKLI